MIDRPKTQLARKVAQLCRTRAATVLPPRELASFQAYLLDCATSNSAFSLSKVHDWREIASNCGISHEILMMAAPVLGSVIDAVRRNIKPNKTRKTAISKAQGACRMQHPTSHLTPTSNLTSPTEIREKRKTGPKPKNIEEFPKPVKDTWADVDDFPSALTLQMSRHDDTPPHLEKVFAANGHSVLATTIRMWTRGLKIPRSAGSLIALDFLDRRYRLRAGYFRSKLPHSDRSTSAKKLDGITDSERRRLAWHLPHDFDLKPLKEREEILEWVQRVVISGATEYRQFQAAAMKHRYSIRFPGLLGSSTQPRGRYRFELSEDGAFPDPDLAANAADAPRQLSQEMTNLLEFKTSILTAFGYQRNGVWGEETASQKVEHLGLMFGALAAAPGGVIRGFGVPMESLTFALLVFPAVWDWYIQWRERRRGFYTAWEVDMLRVSIALTRAETGWLRQNPKLAERLRSVENLVTEHDIAGVRADWDRACDEMYKHGLARAREVQRIARIHRDPFEPIMPILEADSPVGEYRKITDEILRLLPDEKRYPRSAAESVRAFLMLRFGLHLGLRQKNMRQLLVCPRGRTPTTERRLTELKRGELRWSERDGGWEVWIPSVAFKNADSSFFSSKPFRLILPDLGGLYQHLEAYIDRHRRILLKDASDPGTLFVKSVKINSKDAEYDRTSFYDAWRVAIQRYGIHNPFTGRGAIKGLLPHGPHNVRDVLATHILKQTGSYEQASYAIQDTPEMVAKHYGRFLPQDKAALAAQILNQVWQA